MTYHVPTDPAEADRQLLEDWGVDLAHDPDPFIAGYRDLFRRLRAEGFVVAWTCFVCPIQLQGQLPTGEAFYFRGRHTTCRLAIAPAGRDPVRHFTWQYEVERWVDYDAGCLEADEVETVLRELLVRYDAERDQRERGGAP